MRNNGASCTDTSATLGATDTVDSGVSPSHPLLTPLSKAVCAASAVCDSMLVGKEHSKIFKLTLIDVSVITKELVMMALLNGNQVKLETSKRFVEAFAAIIDKAVDPLAPYTKHGYLGRLLSGKATPRAIFQSADDLIDEKLWEMIDVILNKTVQTKVTNQYYLDRPCPNEWCYENEGLQGILSDGEKLHEFAAYLGTVRSILSSVLLLCSFGYIQLNPLSCCRCKC
jgi:hypothetical protein